VRLMVWLRQHAEPARSMSDSELRALIDRQQPRAATYGIVSERGIAKWCYMSVITGERFEQVPGVSDFLRNRTEFTPDKRMDGLMMATARALHTSDPGLKR
jgi:hypothetical protein